jgi:hypothetical protein
MCGGVAVLFVKEGVVVLGGVEGRIEINEVNGLVLEVTPEEVEVIAVIKGAHGSLIVEG